jgi:hypothetical protein
MKSLTLRVATLSPDHGEFQDQEFKSRHSINDYAEDNAPKFIIVHMIEYGSMFICPCFCHRKSFST